MISWTRSLVTKVFAATLCAFACLPVNADALPCETPLVTVDTVNQDLHNRICGIVTSTLPKLSNCHLTLTTPVTISFSTNLANRHGLCFGLFHPDEKRIELLEPTAFAHAHEDTEDWAAIPLAEHYDSIVVHELVHALFDQSVLGEQKCNADEEYIAYALQLENLSEATRSGLLNEVGASSPISMEELNPFVLGFSPPTFAAKSWLHFAQAENGCAFVDKLIRGEATFFIYPE